MTSTVTQDNSFKPELRDHYLVAYILGELVERVLGCDLIAQADTGDREEYPFVTFSFITMESDETSDWLEDGMVYTTQLQLDCHADNLYQATQMAQELHSALCGRTYRNWFKSVDIVPQRVLGTSNRTALEGINYDYDFGFDMEFSVKSKAWTEDQLNFEVIPADEAIESVGVSDSNAHENKRQNN